MTQFKQFLPLVFPAIDNYKSAVNIKLLLTSVTARKPYKTAGFMKWKGNEEVITYYTLLRRCTKYINSKFYDNR